MCIRDRQLSDSAAAGAVFCGAVDQSGVGAARRRRASGTVSYTHLDVYKRQVLLCLAGCFALAFTAAGQTIAVDISHPTNHFVPKETLGAGVDRIAAVSYTHLDVYKRQAARGVAPRADGSARQQRPTVVTGHSLGGCLLYTSRCV